ncbi:DUF221-domain-containing protein [Hortaea werneckii]|uniref:CSC1/OSCA1-like 7TM region domain-containing protein n=1 Tax=Hortaea werneckii TaxID=91943 RepID=A0A3M7CYJ8_HORWE|nr:DUF221-domain-containing protein [Hortaea werneckii]KAI7571034.1 DUF221-domain-containing protein [Hortaea werneckii]KAI7620672.1 DUF221-domain-containing protein [Hortaea werneckii]KAI7629854.1 DUF221-domain-containing protein [Hortaea werneckii]KAI7673642.1 DUF221-domain-containing protein [Hortaea werneckii]
MMESFDPTRTLLLAARQASGSSSASASSSGSSDTKQGSSSVSAFLSTLIPIFVIACIIFGLFLFFQKKYDRVYGPRTFLQTLDKDEYSPKQSPGAFGWAKEFRELADEFVLGHSSLENYLFLRYFKTLIVISFVGCLITWPVLFPVNATGNAPNTSGFDILSFSHISDGARYWAHSLIGVIFFSFVMFVITREMLYYCYMRQAYLLSPYNSSKMSSKTVLFTDVPAEYRNVGAMEHIFPNSKYIWIAADPEDLEDHVKERDQASVKLEGAEMKLIGNYVKKQIKANKKNRGDSEDGRLREQESGSFDIAPKERPTHKLKPLIGKKVDTIDWSRGELHRLIPEVAREQAEKRDPKSNKLAAVFIEFDTIRDAQAAYQQVAHQTPFHMTPRDFGMPPEQVIWGNLNQPWWQRKMWSAFGTAFATFLCIFWTIPIAFAGIITNINYITDKVPFLAWIQDIPPQILGIVTGLIPVVLVAVMMALVPIFLSLVARQFLPTMPAVQAKVQRWYFPFQVVQVFLVTTFTSAATSVVTDIINDPTSAAGLLATNLPKASNFYIVYFVLNGLIAASLQFLNIVPLLFALFLGKILDTTPKKMYNRYVTLGGLGWGAFYPKMTLLGVIALSYSIIAPLVLGFATVGFGLMYLGFRYNVLFTLGTTVDTKGDCYARALKQLITGLYISEICLIGLFAIGSAGNGLVSLGPLIIMIIMLIATVIWNMELSNALDKHSRILPCDLLADEYRDDVTEDVAEKGGATNGHSKKLGSVTSTGLYQLPNSADPPAPPSGLVGKIKSFIFPSKFASAAVLSRYILSPFLTHPVRPYTEKEREEAYLHPALTAEVPIIWLARDPHGLSRREVDACRREIGEGIEVTDEEAWFNEQGKVEWDKTHPQKAPVWEDAPEY